MVPHMITAATLDKKENHMFLGFFVLIKRTFVIFFNMGNDPNEKQNWKLELVSLTLFPHLA